jgi:phosphate transport system substrate-binding protein
VVTKWNDAKLLARNPGAKLSSLAIAPVHRADGSGTTFVFTSYLSAVSPDLEKQGWRRHKCELARGRWCQGK